jgi:hypothetical protein
MGHHFVAELFAATIFCERHGEGCGLFAEGKKAATAFR